MQVDIVPVGEVPADVKREASAALRSVYGSDVNVREEQSIPSGAYNAGREQYRAEDFIQQARRVGRGEKNIAVTPRDLYYHRRNYVFGLAYLDGEGSVISTYRLDEDDDGVGPATDGGFSSKDDDARFGDRVRKEVVHEIGHTMGLEHCSNNRCVMSFSPTVREVDVKEENLCGSCQRDVM
jgi:archaemetzincin